MALNCIFLLPGDRQREMYITYARQYAAPVMRYVRRRMCNLDDRGGWGGEKEETLFFARGDGQF